MPRQSTLRYTFTTAAGRAFDVVEFTLHEALSEPFRLAVELASADASVAFDEVIDREATLTIWHGDVVARHVHGIVTGFALGASGTRRTRYSAVVEPALIRAALCSDWRIFQQQAVPAILGELLKAQGVLHRRASLESPPPPREYCVQAGETDLVFHNRLAAEEGLVYAFVHTDSMHTLIHTDRVQQLGEIEGEPVVYVAAAGGLPMLNTHINSVYCPRKPFGYAPSAFFTLVLFMINIGPLECRCGYILFRLKAAPVCQERKQVAVSPSPTLATTAAVAETPQPSRRLTRPSSNAVGL
jgi:uncharacterized protein involved in type VI secretion and phage assembly